MRSGLSTSTTAAISRHPMRGMSGTLLMKSCGNAMKYNSYGRFKINRLFGGKSYSPISSPWRFSETFRAIHAAPPATDIAPSKQDVSSVFDTSSNGTFKSTAYPFTEIEAKWQAYWDTNLTFRTPEFKDLDTSKPKFYALDMFPYPR